MKWKDLYYLVLFLVLFALPYSSFSQEVILTENEYETLMIALTDSETALKEAKNQLTEQEKLIQQQENEIETLWNIFNVQSLELQTQREFWKMQKNEQTIHDVQMFAWGVLAGFALGNYTGIQIGVRIRY